MTKILGGTPPEGFTYELFLDENGEKISKSRGNGLSVEEWLRYAPPESLSLYMFQQPRRAKRLFFDVIPKAVDEYLAFLDKFPQQTPEERLENPVWHIHGGQPPAETVPIGFAMLLNLASVCNTEDKAVLWGFIARYAPGATPAAMPLLDRLVGNALVYYRDFVKPAKSYRAPDDRERAGFGGSGRRARPNCPPGRTTRRSRTRSTRSASATASSRCATGSRRFTRSCSARARARAWARSSRFTACRRRSR